MSPRTAPRRGTAVETSTYTIGALAKAANVPTSTVRYYERRGLLRPETRTAGNYRVYDRTALERLRFIRAAQATGFTLEDVASLLEFEDGQTSPCEEVQILTEERLQVIDQRLREFRQVKKALEGMLAACRKETGVRSCLLVDQLREDARSGGRKRGPKTRARKSRKSGKRCT